MIKKKPILKKNKIKKIHPLEEKALVSRFNGQTIGLCLKVERTTELIKQKKANKRSLDVSLAELNAISKQIKQSNISQTNKEKMLLNVFLSVVENYLKIRNNYYPKDRIKTERYIEGIIKDGSGFKWNKQAFNKFEFA
jgi:pyruvate carboxylase